MTVNSNPSLELVGTAIPAESGSLVDAPDPVIITRRRKSFIRHTEEEVELAIRNAYGYSSVAARILGITLRGINLRVQKNPKLQEVLQEMREAELDETESQLKRLIGQGNLGAIIWKLKCHGRHRGWVERDDFNAPLNDTVMQPPAIVINFISPKKKENESVTVIPARLGE
jgi:hypothetical protein